mmetsp:Transcript_13703/g.36982  ORF Transcript_13703/g.36982 Transcript_13703/m.36982 type:complete len:316 (+) Transcript_13703:143-1090(+)
MCDPPNPGGIPFAPKSMFCMGIGIEGVRKSVVPALADDFVDSPCPPALPRETPVSPSAAALVGLVPMPSDADGNEEVAEVDDTLSVSSTAKVSDAPTVDPRWAESSPELFPIFCPHPDDPPVAHADRTSYSDPSRGYEAALVCECEPLSEYALSLGAHLQSSQRPLASPNATRRMAPAKVPAIGVLLSLQSVAPSPPLLTPRLAPLPSPPLPNGRLVSFVRSALKRDRARGLCMGPRRKVSFAAAMHVTHEIMAYSTVYGEHPSTFDFGADGEMLPASPSQPVGKEFVRWHTPDAPPDAQAWPLALVMFRAQAQM